MLNQDPSSGRAILFRVDASTTIGTGHVMRCLALAQHWIARRGGAIFAAAEITPSLCRRIKESGCECVRLDAPAGTCEDVACLENLAETRGAEWIVTDGYQFDANYQKRLIDAGLRVLFIDDYGHCSHYFADIVLNQNAYAAESIYANRELDTTLLLGTQFVLLRPEFEARRHWKRDIKAIGRRLLITMGGSDPENQTARILQALPAVPIDGLETRVLVGGSNPHAESLRHIVSSTHRRVTFVEGCTDVAEMMAWPDVAISAGGTTCWEMCFLGLPFLALSVAPNQQPVGSELHRRGAAIYLGPSSQVTCEKIAIELTTLLQSATRREEMARAGRSLVDGRGASRVIGKMYARGLRLRSVREEDCRRLWLWANDPLVRKVSFSTQSIAWEEHVQWFASRMADAAEMCLIVEDSDSRPLGYIRYRLGAARAEVSITIDPEFRGEGIGSTALSLATTELFRKTDAIAVDAWIKSGNQPSINAFLRAGYRLLGVCHVKGQEAVHFVAEKRV